MDKELGLIEEKLNIIIETAIMKSVKEVLICFYKIAKANKVVTLQDIKQFAEKYGVEIK